MFEEMVVQGCSLGGMRTSLPLPKALEAIGGVKANRDQTPTLYTWPAMDSEHPPGKGACLTGLK